MVSTRKSLSDSRQYDKTPHRIRHTRLTAIPVGFDGFHVWNRPHEMIFARNTRGLARRFLDADGLSALGGFR
jgi:hypothetical protein